VKGFELAFAPRGPGGPSGAQGAANQPQYISQFSYLALGVASLAIVMSMLAILLLRRRQ